MNIQIDQHSLKMQQFCISNNRLEIGSVNYSGHLYTSVMMIILLETTNTVTIQLWNEKKRNECCIRCITVTSRNERFNCEVLLISVKSLSTPYCAYIVSTPPG